MCRASREGQLAGMGVGGQQAVSQPAVDALAGLAVVAAQLDEGLAGQCIVTLDASSLEHRHDAVLLGTDVLEQGNGAVGHLVVVGQFSVSVIEWGNLVDEYDVDAALALGATCAGRRFAELVMRRPVAAQFNVK